MSGSFTPFDKTTTASWYTWAGLFTGSILAMVTSFVTATRLNYESFQSLDYFKHHPADCAGLIMLVHVFLMLILISLINADNQGLEFAGSPFDVQISRGFYKSIVTITMWVFALVLVAVFIKIVAQEKHSILDKFRMVFLVIGFLFFVTMGIIPLTNADLSKNGALDDTFALNGQLYLALIWFVIIVANSAWVIISGNFAATSIPMVSQIVKFICILSLPLIISLLVTASCIGYKYTVDLSKPGYYVTAILTLIIGLVAVATELYHLAGSGKDIWRTIGLLTLFTVVAIIALIKSGLVMTFVILAIPTYVYCIAYEYKIFSFASIDTAEELTKHFENKDAEAKAQRKAIKAVKAEFKEKAKALRAGITSVTTTAPVATVDKPA